MPIESLLVNPKYAASLSKFLAMPVAPLHLSVMRRAPAPPTKEALLTDLQQLASRTARCYDSFNQYAVMERKHATTTIDKRLLWMQQYCLLEFQHCVALHEAADSYGQLQMDGAVPLSQQCSYRVAVEQDPQSMSEPQLASYGGGGMHVHAAPQWSGASSPTHMATDMEMRPLAFPVALEALRPAQSLLDILVNEDPILCHDLNRWLFSFCRQRAGWRVLHEHMLHQLLPEQYPAVVAESVNVVQLLRQSAQEVVEVFSNALHRATLREISVSVHVEENTNLLHTLPAGELLTSSRSQFRAGEVQLPEEVERSSTVCAVEGHLTYVLRELLKNACFATANLTDQIEVTVEYAMNDQWVVVDVVDRAGGIPASSCDHIWKFGWTTSEHVESALGGFGVGLSTSKVYMDMWGGCISIFAQPQHGSTVRVQYPTSPTEDVAIS